MMGSRKRSMAEQLHSQSRKSWRTSSLFSSIARHASPKRRLGGVPRAMRRTALRDTPVSFTSVLMPLPSASSASTCLVLTSPASWNCLPGPCRPLCPLCPMCRGRRDFPLRRCREHIPALSLARRVRPSPCRSGPCQSSFGPYSLSPGWPGFRAQ